MRSALWIGVGLMVLGCGVSDAPPPMNKDTSATSVGGGGAGGEDASGGGGSGGETSGTGGSGGDGDGGSANLGWESGTRLRARVFHGDDGARQFAGWFDSMLNVNCFPYETTDGARRCVPQAAASVGSFFQDAACQSPVVLVPIASGCPLNGSYVHELVTPAACESTKWQVRQLGGQIPATSIWQGASCTGPIDQSANYAAYSTTPPLDPTQFVEMTEMVE